MTATTYDAKNLTLEEKASLTSGGDMWHLQAVEDKGVPGWMITDGPHGLRKNAGNPADVDDSVPATCFPPAAGMASSWNPELVEQVGDCLAEECMQEKVAVILGPGVNIKRNPLGGRSFEYWSEDPLVAGEQAAALVRGVQARGIGTSLKHFAANSQETDRLRVSARISERAMREIYLPAFEYVIKHANPWTVMCSYNKINGVYSSENHWLLTDVLRGEWGYKGIVMSDWGACHKRVESLNAGLDLEMPPSKSDDQIVEAVRDGRIDERTLDERAQGMLDLASKATPAMEQDGYRYDVDRHHAVARRAADESIVLLKNDDNLLPLAGDEDIAVIGEFARTPRYQGGGSSHIHPTRVSSFLDALGERSVEAHFAPGFTLDDKPQDEDMVREAVELAGKHRVVVMFLGLPESAESEGYDRKTFDIPSKQIELLRRVSAVNPHVAVILSNGSAVSVSPWRDHAQALIEGWLLGQAGGEATADAVFGDVNPSGKLAQSIAMRLEDDPSYINFPGGEGTVDYGEGVFVGYRYYDTVGREVAYPFGYGLSYTTFGFGELSTQVVDGNCVEVSVKVTNTGARAGAEVVQLYVAPTESPVNSPAHQLRAFTKVSLEPGESTVARFTLDSRAFSYWSEAMHDWHVVAGDYRIEVGSSSRDLPLTATVSLPGDGKSLALDEFSTHDEWLADSIGGPIIRDIEANAPDDVKPMLNHPKVQDFIHEVPMTMLAAFGGPHVRTMVDELLARYTKEFQAKMAH